MLWFKNKKIRNKKRKAVRTIDIQASIEGEHLGLMIESLLTGQTLNISVPGTTNAYTNYETQVDETYRKYNGNASFGNQQTRAIVDLRTGFIAGEGISISSKDRKLRKWLDEFLTINKLRGFNFTNAIKSGEMTGQNLFILKPFYSELLEKEHVKATRIPYFKDRKFKPIYSDSLIREDVVDVAYKSDTGWIKFGFSAFIYFRTGGDDCDSYGATTKVGVVLTDIENYDRALRDLRRLNHVLARITPTFKTENETATRSLKKWLEEIKWKIGTAFIGSAEFDYKAPGNTAHQNLIDELNTTLKTITATTSVPVHWLGYVDLMSNRSTAESLYEFIKAGTKQERLIWKEAIKELCLKAMELYINNGGTEITYNTNFSVDIPLLNFDKFKELVSSLSIAYKDGAISIDDYMNMIPGIDPLITKEAIEKQEKEEQKKLLKAGISYNKDDMQNTEQQNEENNNQGVNDGKEE